MINNNAKRFLELLNITQHIQYNNPSKDNCPVCGEYNSLFLLHNLQGIWACCTECKTRGMENDWLELLENDKPINNFYSHTWNMLSKYGDRMYKENLDEAQKDILVRMGCEPGKKSDFPYIGVTTVGEFNVDLAMASRAEGGVEIKRQGHKFLKQDQDIIVIPIYEARHKIAGFSLHNGKAWVHRIYGDPKYMFYVQGSSLYNERVLIADNLKQMMKLQSEQHIRHTVPIPMIKPFRPAFKSVAVHSINKFILSPAFYMLTYNRPWSIQLGEYLDKISTVYYLSQAPGDFIKPTVLADYPHLFQELPGHFKQLSLNYEMPKFPITWGEGYDVRVSKKGIFVRVSQRSKEPIVRGFIHVEGTDNENEFRVFFLNGNDYTSEIANREVFKTRELFNIFLRNAHPYRKKIPQLLDVWESKDILGELLAIQPRTRSFLNEHKEKRIEKEGQSKSAKATYGG